MILFEVTSQSTAEEFVELLKDIFDQFNTGQITTLDALSQIQDLKEDLDLRKDLLFTSVDDEIEYIQINLVIKLVINKIKLTNKDWHKVSILISQNWGHEVICDRSVETKTSTDPVV